ncbi:MAG: 1,4-dihydroxy-2-naphthoate polyprenyltransferase [Anaerolineales bacterium]|nr:1,4-dihydroxy-2-naphthoate polyprenyltransferase [Anaerolineales bacterium]
MDQGSNVGGGKTSHNTEISSVQAWLLASRPKTLTAAVAPVMVGSAVAIAYDEFHLGIGLLALFVAIMIQVGTNFYNDVVDFEQGTDTGDRLGPMRVTQMGLLTPRQVKTGVVVTFTAAAVAGLILAWVGGWPVVIIGLACILAGLAYSSGPFPLTRLGLGDLFAMVFFGFVGVAGTVYVQMGEVPGLAWWAALGVGATITALLIVNNIRDIDSDRRAGRRTLPVVWGKNAGLIEYVAMLVIAYTVPLVVILKGWVNAWALIPLLSVPLAVFLVRWIAITEGEPLNRALAGTGQLVLLYGFLFSAGIVLGIS